MRWDMHAIATFERLAGVSAVDGFEISVSNAIDVVWSAIDADAASRDEDAPVSRRKFGTMMVPSDAQKLMNAITELLGYSMPEPKPEKKVTARKRSRAKKSRSRSSTNGARSTSASASASSGD